MDAVSREMYRGHTIFADETSDPPRLEIDGRTIPVSRYRGGGDRSRFATPVMIYADYLTLIDLAHAMIDTGVLRFVVGPDAAARTQE